MKQSGVFIGSLTVANCHSKANGDPIKMFRRLLEKVFGKEILATSTAFKQGREKGFKPLDQKKLEAIMGKKLPDFSLILSAYDTIF